MRSWRLWLRNRPRLFLRDRTWLRRTRCWRLRLRLRLWNRPRLLLRDRTRLRRTRRGWLRCARRCDACRALVGRTGRRLRHGRRARRRAPLTKRLRRTRRLARVCTTGIDTPILPLTRGGCGRSRYERRLTASFGLGRRRCRCPSLRCGGGGGGWRRCSTCSQRVTLHRWRWRCCRRLARIDDPGVLRRYSDWSRSSVSLKFSTIERFAGVLFERRKLLRDRDGRRRRRRLGDHYLLLHRGRRCCSRGWRRANECGPGRRNLRHRLDLRRVQRRARQPHRDAVDGLRLRERRRRHCGHRVRSTQVYVVDLLRYGRGGGGDVRDIGVVDYRVVDHRVADVHLPIIFAADIVCRPVNLTGREWKPANRGSGRHRHAEVRPADERHQCRCIDRPYIDGSRHPTPAAFDIRPAAVVERRETPRGIIHPRPSPRIDPRPMAFAIRRPTARHLLWKPYVPVTLHGAPRPVAVEILVADDFRRHVTHRHHAIEA